jgi:hypothetical protein
MARNPFEFLDFADWWEQTFVPQHPTPKFDYSTGFVTAWTHKAWEAGYEAGYKAAQLEALRQRQWEAYHGA